MNLELIPSVLSD